MLLHPILQLLLIAHFDAEGIFSGGDDENTARRKEDEKNSFCVWRRWYERGCICLTGVSKNVGE